MKTITIQLNSASVKEAVLRLAGYRTSISPAVSRAMNTLMYDAADYLERILQIEQDPQDQRIRVSATPTEVGFVLTMTGQGVGFVEFGTGAYADTSHPFVDQAPFPVYSGSWSDDHEGTWQAYVKSGLYADSNGEYLYNRFPVRPLYETSVWIKDNYAKYFRETFKEIKL